MTREFLTDLADNNPQKLSQIFSVTVGDGKLIECDDWTAVINAGKKAGIDWDMNTARDGRFTCWAWRKSENETTHRAGLHEKPNWPDCAALMIVMIEVVEASL